MTEEEVNLKVKEWLQNHSFRYKGVCNTRQDHNPLQHNTENGKSIHNTKTNKYSLSKQTGYGQVPVPDAGEGRAVLIDHQGFRDDIPDLVWIEAKGSDVNFSQLLEGFIRTVYAIYHGGGNGYLAVPHSEYQKLIEQKDFLKAVADSVNGKGTMGLLDVEKNTTIIV